MFEFLESKTFVSTTTDLDQTLEHANTKRLADLGPTDVPRYLIYDDQISRSMTHLVAILEYVSLFDVWASQFDKLK